MMASDLIGILVMEGHWLDWILNSPDVHVTCMCEL